MSARQEKQVDLSVFYAVSTTLIVTGIVIIVIAIIVISNHSTHKESKEQEKRRVKAAGVIMIGPIPIIFGTDKKSVKTILVLALALVIALIIAMLVYYWLLR